MNKGKLIGVVIVFLLILTGFVVVKTLRNLTSGDASVMEKVEPESESIPEVDPSITVTVKARPNNSVVLEIIGMGGKMSSIAYELTYESQGLIKGVNSGSKPIDVAGEDELSREVYMGTCSRNVCKPDAGVHKVTIALEFTDSQGKKSQFTEDFELY